MYLCQAVAVFLLQFEEEGVGEAKRAARGVSECCISRTWVVKMALSAQCAGFLRMFVAFLGVIFLLAGIALQFAAAGSLYGIR